MLTPSEALPKRKRASYLRVLLGLVLIVGILYAAEKVIVPLALAVLLTFILTPLVVLVQQRGLKRVYAVLVVVTLTFGVFGLIGWGVGAQLVGLADDLPHHKDQMKAKVARIRSSEGGPLSRLFHTFNEVGKTRGDGKSGADATPEKQPIIARPEEPSAFQSLSSLAAAILEPVATAGLVLILVIFMLIKREDLRNRMIGVLGHGQLTGTTRVLVEAAQRLSRLLLTQLCINAGFGVVFGVAMLIIGVPYWFLWGFLMAVLRFVPYVGSWMAAGMPLVLSLAISPGWQQPILVLAVFLVLDLGTANILEPLLFGHSTGVSPVALLIAAVFWTWVWGPVGLVLSTPLTVCLVVLGMHVPRFKFLSLLLGDQPALPPHATYYQRLLAGDAREAADVARAHALAHGFERVPDEVFIPAVLLARRDRQRAGLTAEDEAFIFDTTKEILDRLETEAVAASDPALRDGANADKSQPPACPALILGCPAHHRSEELALSMLAGVMKRSGCNVEVVSTRTLPAEIESRIEQEHPALVFIAVLPPGGLVQASYLCRRLRKRFGELKTVVGYWGRVRDFDKLLVRLRVAGASYVTTSLLQSRSQILALLTPPPPPAEAATGVAQSGAAFSPAIEETPGIQIAAAPAVGAH